MSLQRPLLTTIVATIGPASDSPDMVRRLIESGVAVFRFNFSHGDLEAHGRRLATVRKVAASLGRSIACLGDLQGPKIRVGKVPAGLGRPHPSGGSAIDVTAGQDVVFKQGIDEASLRQGDHGVEAVLPVTFQPLVDEVEAGHKVLINDGAIRMLAIGRDAPGELRCRVVIGGAISSGKGINVPQSSLSAPAITERDWECARWAAANDLDYLALSFVRSARDVEQLRAGLDAMKGVQPGRGPDEGAWIPIIAKVEMPEAVACLDEVVAAADGIMVARGDLGVEMDIAQVPVVQKRIVRTCREFGKPCIVATQMLESMIEQASPTRAEATDVANAVFEGADAVMLSAETATGRHPVTVVETMARIIRFAESHMEPATEHTHPSRMADQHKGTAALAHGAWRIARDISARAVVVWSQAGGTARYLSQNRFAIPIIAYSSDPAACRRMALLRGVTPVQMQPPASGTISAWAALVDESLMQMGVAQMGEAIVLLAGRPLGQAKRTNTLAIHRIGGDAAA